MNREQHQKELNTDPDTIKMKKNYMLFKEYYMPKRNTYQSRGVILVKQVTNETHEEHWRKLVA